MSNGLFSKDNKFESSPRPQKSLNTYYLIAASIMETAQENKSIIEKKRIRIINLGSVINHAGVDYAPTVSADGRTLFYVSERPGSRWNVAEDYSSHDFWAAKKNDRLDTVFFAPYNIDTLTNLKYLNVNTEFNEGAASISADRQSIYFTACNRPNGFGGCDIYMSTLEGDKWGQPTNLGKNVNSDKFDSQPSISPDKKRIYFVSSRKGPNSDGKDILENMDIWYSNYNDDNEEWGPAINLEELNTSEQEFTPFIAADNVTLFFASKGHKPNLGGLDFYWSRLDQTTNKWSKPENLGEPINTKADEMFITLPASGDIIYFSSDRTDLPGYQGSLDIFMAFVPSYFKAVNVITTVVDECSGEFIPATISVKNNATQKVVVDSVTFFKPEFELIVSNADYGAAKDSLKYVDLEITATNPKYGSKTVTQRVDRPSTTEDPDETKKSDEIKVKITLGQRPVLAAEMDEADYIRSVKAGKPKLATYRGLVMKETKTRNLYPLLNYVFFDEGKSVIPDRYILLTADQTPTFNDTTILGGTLDKYYHMMNIYAYRLIHFPKSKIKIIGCNDNDSKSEKGNTALSKERAMNVFNYFKNVWKIDEKRMEVSWINLPKLPTSTRVDSIGIQENRRVEIICEDWDIARPVFDVGSVTEPQPVNMHFAMKNGIQDELVAKRRIEINRGEKNWNTLTEIGTTDPKNLWNWKNTKNKYPLDEVSFTAQLVITTKSGAECKSDPIVIPVMQVTTDRIRIEKSIDSTREIYNLILFPFDRFDAGPINERILNDYVYQRVYPTSYVEVTGHTDVVGMYDHNKKLSENRAKTVRDGVNKKSSGKYGSLNSQGVGEEDPLYTNELPEGRFYNRTVQVIIKTPLNDVEGK
jgi:outer membrane protein OmpA-like peptidoglycan-associated protein